jgi:hypothetical protein
LGLPDAFFSPLLKLDHMRGGLLFHRRYFGLRIFRRSAATFLGLTSTTFLTQNSHPASGAAILGITPVSLKLSIALLAFHTS